MAAEYKCAGSATEVIRQRKSWRNYTNKQIEPAKNDRLLELMAKLDSGPLGSPCRFILADVDTGGISKIMGTYGVIKGATKFIAGAVGKGDKDMEDFGYLFEQIVLLATELDLGTCWLGDTFNKNMFAGKLALKSGELMPAVSPIGYASEKTTLVGQVFRSVAGSKNRKPWEELFFDGSFNTPLSTETAGNFATPLEMVRIGPSATNKQPWRIVRYGSTFHLFLQRTKNYAKEGSDIDLQRIDTGIAMCHFEIAAAELGAHGTWSAASSPDIGTLPEDTTYVATWSA